MRSPPSSASTARSTPGTALPIAPASAAGSTPAPRPESGSPGNEVAALPGTEGRSCGDTFGDLFNAYREAVATNGGPNRADDPVGQHLPAFGVTGVLTGDAITQWEEARAAWIAAAPIDFEPDFADIGVGYWGQERELRRMEQRLDRRYDDLISRQFVPLGPASWREVLSSSPAEPGFSPAVPLSSGYVSVGGWADPLRVTPLDALGARVTIAVNRLGGVGGFTESVTRLLNASDDDIAALYSTTDPASSFFVGLAEATGVWCTDWDGQGGDPNLLFNDAYTSPLITDSRQLLRPHSGLPERRARLPDRRVCAGHPGREPLTAPRSKREGPDLPRVRTLEWCSGSSLRINASLERSGSVLPRLVGLVRLVSLSRCGAGVPGRPGPGAVGVPLARLLAGVV